MITAQQIKKIAPTAKPALVDAIVRGWDEAAASRSITTPKRAAAFLANICTETGGLTILSESGAYSAAGIMRVFGVGVHSARVTQAEANRIAALPVSQRGPVLFDRVYGLGNPRKARELGNTQKGDGWRFRGGGMFQTTGRGNYRRRGKQTGLPLEEKPELVRDPDTAFKTAWLEWSARCNTYADAGNLVAVRKIINGGTNGMTACWSFYRRALQVLAAYSFDPASANAEGLLSQPETNDAPVDAEAPDDAAPEDSAADDTAADTDAAGPAAAPAEGSDDQGLDTGAGQVADEGNPALYDGQYHHEVMLVQVELGKLGYAHGKDDGKWGGMLAGAIAAFMNDRHLFGAPVINDTLRQALDEAMSEGFTRPIADARAHASAADVPEAKQSLHGQITAAFGAVGAMFTAFMSSVGDYLDTAKGWIEPLKHYLTDVPGWGWAMAIGGVCVFLFLKSGAAKKAALQAYQTGQRS